MEWNISFRFVEFMNVCNTLVRAAKINLECVWHTTKNVVHAISDTNIKVYYRCAVKEASWKISTLKPLRTFCGLSG